MSILIFIVLAVLMVGFGLLQFAAGANEDVSERSRSVMGESPMDRSMRRFWRHVWLATLYLPLLVLLFLGGLRWSGFFPEGLLWLWEKVSNALGL